ncbi:MAG: sugar nucleotide-binding protein, partial [Oceanospirillales bacterium]|nr:sugar nucleotide-binding protein [Oceanospirillales bacterium]
YGQHKCEVESFLAAYHSRAAVLRLTKVIGNAFPLLENTIAKVRAGERANLFRDLNLAPVALTDVVGCIRILLQQSATGIFHLSGSRNLSYAEAGAWLLQQLGMSPDSIVPVAAASAGIEPLSYSSLKNAWPPGWCADTAPEQVLLPLLQRLQRMGTHE